MGRRQKQYKCICQNCGKMFFSKWARVNCDECQHYGKAQKVADELIATPVSSSVQAIPSDTIEEMAKQAKCNEQSVKAVLRKKGYVAKVVYVREWEV